MARSALISRLLVRYPLLTELRFGLEDAGEAPPIGLALLLAAAEKREPGACCFVFPRSTRLALTTAVVGALTRLKREFPARLNEYARRGLRKGQRVSVLPTGHVYEFDGLFDDVNGRFQRPSFRLKVISLRRVSKKGWPVISPAVRSFPVDEILRLRPTSDSSPLGRDNTDLEEWRESALDCLLGIRSGGNAAIFGNHALLLTMQNEARRFADCIRVGMGNCAALSLRELMTWGRIDDGGVLEPADGGAADEEPLVATTHMVEQLADACERVEPCSKLVVIDGATAVTRNLQAFDRVAACQRAIIVADDEDDAGIDDLASRGCLTWKLSADDVIGAADDQEAAGQQRREGRASSVFLDVRRAAVNASRLRLTTAPVVCDRLDEAADALASASRAMPDEDVLGPILGQGFGLLLEASAWFVTPSADDIDRFRTRLVHITETLELHATWVPGEYSTGLRHAVAALESYVGDPSAGVERFNAILTALDGVTANGLSYAMVTPTIGAANSLQRLLSEYVARPSVYTAAALPNDLEVDQLIVTSWPKSKVLRSLLARYCAPTVCVAGCVFEHRWLKGVLSARSARERRWRLDSSTRKTLFDVPDDVFTETGDPDRNERPDGDAADASLTNTRAASGFDRLEQWSRPRRKGAQLTGVVIDAEMRPARYVGFVGRTYAYVTPSRSLPVVTDLVRRESGDRSRVRLSTVEQLKVGEYVLFRDSGDHDVIALLAEDMMGSDRYRRLRTTAEAWKPVIRGIAASTTEIHRRLEAVGVRRHYVTVRSWVLDPDKIGPGERSDLLAIARAAQSDQFLRDVDRIWDAIHEIRGAHIAAGQRLSEILLAELPKKLSGVRDEESQLDLTFGHAWVVQVEEIGGVEERPYTEVNRLLWDGECPRVRSLTPNRAVRAISNGAR